MDISQSGNWLEVDHGSSTGRRCKAGVFKSCRKSESDPISQQGRGTDDDDNKVKKQIPFGTLYEAF
jgi:hypothetical protein